MLIQAVKECPQGQMPGTIWEAPDAAAEVLISVGAARRVEDDGDDTSEPGESRRRGRRRYQTREMVAEADA